MAAQPSPADFVRVRFAPSPTGNLHLGGARTALFNWMFARHHGGAFLLRVEDTDRERSRQEFVAEIIESLHWLGMCWDGPPFFQSRRGDLYRSAADRLLAAGHAYRCFCRPEELEERRRQAEEGGGGFRYDGRCASLGEEEARRRIAAGERPAIRVRVPAGFSSWDDLVRGSITFDHAQLDDFVIVKGDGSPTYHFAVVVDDVDMEITHVIRGEDHISNTPKQLVLYDALGAAPPRFAHIPLILGTDGKRLSKRHGATAVSDYRRQGYLPGALVNYLALLGWSPGDDREVLPLQELVAAFDLGRVVRTPAVFDLEKLAWMNAVYYASLSVPRRANLVIPHLMEGGLLKPGEDDAKRLWIERVVEAVGDRVKLLPDIVPYVRFLFDDEVAPDEKAAAVLKKAAGDGEWFARIREALAGLEVFTREPIEKVIRGVMAEGSLSANRVIQPLRAAVAGTTVSPGLFESLELLGRERTLERIDRHLLG